MRDDCLWFERLIEDAPIGVFESALDGRVKFVNRALVEQLEAGSREALLSVSSTCIYKDPRERDRILQRLRQGERVRDHEIELISLRGTPRVALISAWLSDGMIRGFCVNITELKRVERELRLSRDDQRRFLESLPAGVIEIAEGGIAAWASTEALAKLGISKERLEGFNIKNFAGMTIREDGSPFPVEEYPAIRCLEFGEPEARATIGVKRPDGSVAWAIYNAVSVVSQAKRVAVVTFVDISDRKRAERALLESEERYRALVEDSPDPLVVQSKGKLLFVNKAGARLLQRQPEELVGIDSIELAHPDDRSVFERKMTELWRNGEPSRAFETRLLRADGKAVDVEVAAVLVMFRGRKAIQVVARDITERKRALEDLRRLESQVQYAQKLESLGVLAGGIAHDFNNLLAVIMGNAGLARMNVGEDSPVRRNIDHILASAERAAELTKQMLAYAGKGRLVVERVNLAALVSEMTELLRTAISKKVRLDYQVEPNLPAVEADAAQMQQIVMNLITNAADAIGDRSGGVNVAIRQLELDPKQSEFTFISPDLRRGRFVCLEVTDTGDGMSPDTLARIFDPFFTTKSTGRGLGLAATIGIVRGHAGALRVESAEGQGTRFQVFIPAAEGERKFVVQPSTQFSQVASGATVLVIDDEASVRDIVRASLEAVGCQVLLAEGGQQGVAVFEQHRAEINAVLVDMTMPDLSGEEVLRRLRRLAPEIPVIVSSGYSAEEASERMSDAACDFLQKPYRPERLFEVLERSLRKVQGAFT